MLSVPGKSDIDSVYGRVRRMYPEATGPMIVHRLDMATSGLILIAKTKEVHQNLRAQFKNRTVCKRYVAWLDGIVEKKEGHIELPSARIRKTGPRQVVDAVHGKPAVTDYTVRIMIRGVLLFLSYRKPGAHISCVSIRPIRLA